MNTILNWSYRKIENTSLKFERYLSTEINWNNKLIVIVGGRGVGKTTLMLQQLKKNHTNNESILYTSLDNLYFSKHSIIDLVEEFVALGGKHLFLDEIQKYSNWSIEIKNIHDNFPNLQLVLSGSSTTEILKSEGDLSRRAIFYKMSGLSFREFLNINYEHDFESISLDDIIKNHKQISFGISEKIKPIKEFNLYLKSGYYPFYNEDKEGYHQRLRQVINTVIEVDISAVHLIDYSAVLNIKKLLGIITELVPFKPNVKRLSEQIGISRESFVKYLSYLEKAEVVNLLYAQTKGIALLRKPEKIYLNNTNISFALNNTIDVGNARETFFINQIKQGHDLFFSDKGDFLVDNKFTFEVGGKNKTTKQIKGVKNAFIAADNIEFSNGNKIPLWLFGMMY